MPVYITNRMYLPQDGVERVLAYVGGTEPLDFNTVQPMPWDLTGQEARDWCSAFWGTEENAVHAELMGNILTFRTADTPPLAWLKEVSAQFPQYEFTLDWFYDDLPEWYQCVVRGGKVQYINGV